MKRLIVTVTALVATALLPAAASAQNLTADLAGGFSGGASADATGYAVLAIDGTTITSTILTQGLANPTGAQIQRVSDGTLVTDLGVSFSGALGTGTVSANAGDVSAVLGNPGAYRVQVESQSFPSGAIRGTLQGVTAGGGGATALYFPVAAAISGQAGTRYLTDARIINRSGGMAGVTLEYFPEGGAGNPSGPAHTATLTISPNEEAVLDDFVANEFGVSNGKGAVHITSDYAITAFARVYNDKTDLSPSQGTLGQFVAGLPMSAAYGSGQLPFLSNQPAGTGAGYRANMGWFNPSDATVSVTFWAWDAATGQVIGSKQRTVQPYAQQQFNVSSGELFGGAFTTRDDFYVTYQTSGGDPLFVYASIADNVNGDAVYAPASP